MDSSDEEVDFPTLINGRIQGTDVEKLTFSPRSFPSIFAPLFADRASLLYKELKADCVAIGFRGGARETYWLPASAEPRCTLERLARRIFELHVTEAGAEFDAASSGAEFWTQVRSTGGADKGVGFHWDKDERMHSAYNIFVHPQISTVTYLGDAGAPTVVLEDALSDDSSRGGAVRSAFVSRTACR